MSVNKFLKGVGKGAFGSDTIRDYTHASDTFVADTYALQPRHKHLFHVVFNFSAPAMGEVTKFVNNTDRGNLHLFVKSIELPQFTIEVEDQNQYNRHRYTQHKVNYQPVNISFHDDQADTIRRLWYAYYRFFYQDTDYDNGDQTSLHRAYTQEDVYRNRTPDTVPWGMDRGPASTGALRFFSDIRIYSMFQGKYVEHTLVNPIITSFSHDRHAYADGDTMEHTMQVQYESVLYAEGRTAEDNPTNFAVSHYDKTPSPLSPGGVAGSVIGEGGLLDGLLSANDSFSNGNVLGGLFQLGKTVYNSRNTDIKNVLKGELAGAAKAALRGQNPLAGTVFPKAVKTIGNVATIIGNSTMAGPPGATSSQGTYNGTTKNNVAAPWVNPDKGQSGVTVNNTNKTKTNPRKMSSITSNLSAKDKNLLETAKQLALRTGKPVTLKNGRITVDPANIGDEGSS